MNGDQYSQVEGGMNPMMGMPQQEQEYSYVPPQTPLIAQEGITKWLQNPKEIIRDIGLKLRGLEYNKKTKAYEQVRDPLLSEHGIKLILSTLDFHINRTVTLSNLDETMVNKMALTITIAMANHLQQDWVKAGLQKEELPVYTKERGVKTIILKNNIIIITHNHKVVRKIIPNFDLARYKLIVKNIDDILFSNLSRAKDGGERRFLTKITTEHVQSIKRDTPEKEGGIMSKALGMPASLFKG